MAQYFEMDDPFRALPKQATAPTPIPTITDNSASTYDAQVRARLAQMRQPAAGGAGATPPAPPTATVAPAGAPKTPETAARARPGLRGKAGLVGAVGGAVLNQVSGGSPLTTAGLTTLGAAPFAGAAAPLVAGAGGVLTAAGAVQDVTGLPTITEGGARRFDSQIVQPLRRLFGDIEFRGSALTQPSAQASPVAPPTPTPQPTEGVEVPVRESVVDKPDPLAVPTIGNYLKPEVYGPIVQAVGGDVGGARAPTTINAERIGQNQFGIAPDAVRTNTVQAVKAPDGSTVYTNYATPGTPAATAQTQQFAAPTDRYGALTTQGAGVQGAANSILGLGALRIARADEFAKAKLQNQYRTAVATQLLKNEAAQAEKDKPIKVTLPGFAEGVLNEKRGTMTTFSADGTATVKPVTGAAPTFSEAAVRQLNKKLLERDPNSSLKQRRDAIESIYRGKTIENAWLL